MKDHGNCPHCNADLNGGSIWKTFYEKYQTDGYFMDENGKYSRSLRLLTPEQAEIAADESASMYGANRTEGQWGRAIGQYCYDRDRTVSYQCPDCEGTWPR